ncbi:glutamine amidotransferase-related protein [Neptuniibacter caesariensis]|uniref:Glutamine amidotransferase class-I n=1 Tax=Neptuniibacter caesariensis TaxID=207954 RepID=A0A7U8C1W8_NEPCE|nr:gamma-glutamyl-gamma-aminobutyrate hydrolase family protein [Neptuniibacter caesariensis]EAR59970.1 Glutamine amidotransferase class-I [Oceanospirillum sp. MED92] [Neptuniibacter caesariensis]
MKLGILVTGDTTGELNAKYGSFTSMFIDLFEQQGVDLTYLAYDLREGQFPYNINECDAWLITGSEHGVYDKLPWMQPLEAMIREIIAAELPLIGICFGHQIMASAMGAMVEKSDKGWGLGHATYQVCGKGAVKEVVINAMHQDQVISMPEQAELLLTSEFCPYAGFTYGPKVLSIQAHPEFMNEYTLEQLLELKGKLFPERETKIAFDGLMPPKKNLDTDIVAGWMLSALSA